VARGKRNWPWADTEAAVALMKSRMRKVVPVTVETNAEAMKLARDQGLALYDALIVAAAMGAGCDTLWSEDMQHGRVIGGLTIRNSFLESVP
jgi:predicted nucleic acid-binding protein